MEDLVTNHDVTDLIRHKEFNINLSAKNISENMEVYLRTIENLKEEYSDGNSSFQVITN